MCLNKSVDKSGEGELSLSVKQLQPILMERQFFGHHPDQCSVQSTVQVSPVFHQIK